MPDPSGAWVDTILAARRADRLLALIADYDGTLTPLTRHPSLARLSEPLRATLAELSRRPGVAVGVVSGRPLHELQAFVRLPGVFYAGSSGAELDLLGERIDAPEAAAFRRIAPKALAALNGLLARYPAAWVEGKPVGLALHHRELPPADAERFCDAARLALAPFPELRCREVTHTLEITPAGGWTKGTAVARMLARVGGEPLAVYAGDGSSDAEPMAEVLRRGGIAVGVGPAPPAESAWRAPASADFERQLLRLAAGLRAAAPAERLGVLLVGPAALALADGLGRSGWVTWSAAGAAAAFGVLESRPPELRAAVVDLALPGMQGAQLLGEVERLAPRLARLAAAAPGRSAPGVTVLDAGSPVGAWDRALRESLSEREERA